MNLGCSLDVGLAVLVVWWCWCGMLFVLCFRITWIWLGAVLGFGGWFGGLVVVGFGGVDCGFRRCVGFGLMVLVSYCVLV